MIITYIHSTQPEDTFQVQLRCRNFADAINRMGWHCAHLLDLDSFIQNTPEANRLCSASHLLVIHRYLYGPVLEAIQYWKARGKKVIVDFDQAINFLTPDIHPHSFWLKEYAGHQTTSTPLEQFKWGLGLIDGAVVPSTRLVIDWSPFTEVYEVPDYLNTDQYPASKQAHANEVWIGIANNTRMASVQSSGLLQALETICRARRQVRVVLCDVAQSAHALSAIRPSQLVLYPPYLFEEWADALLKLDLGLLPLHGDYDLRLGRVSLIEFMISKTPWVATHQPSFRGLSRYGKLVQNSARDWELAILKVLDNLDLFHKKAAGEPFLFALSQDINENIDKVLKVYTHILHQAQRSGAR